VTRRSGSIEVEIGDHAFQVRAWGRLLTIPFAPATEEATDEADLLVSLDAIDQWDPPDEERLVELEELAKILEAIERECDKRRLLVAFE
jgi:Immunity protein 74